MTQLVSIRNLFAPLKSESRPAYTSAGRLNSKKWRTWSQCHWLVLNFVKTKNSCPKAKWPRSTTHIHELRGKFRTLPMTEDSLHKLIWFSNRGVKTWDFQFESLHLAPIVFFFFYILFTLQFLLIFNLRRAFFWDFTHCTIIVCYWMGQPLHPIFKGQAVFIPI